MSALRAGGAPANPAVGHVPEAPTLPTSGDDGGAAFDVADLYRGPVAAPAAGDRYAAARLVDQVGEGEPAGMPFDFVVNKAG